MITNNESAEYGRSSGATVNVASKSGTNQIHATLYEFIRNTDLNAFGYIKPISTNAVTGTVYPFFKPVFNRNQFGVNFGGPIIKNRFFWFVDYEGFRQTLTPTVIDTCPQPTSSPAHWPYPFRIRGIRQFPSPQARPMPVGLRRPRPTPTRLP